MTTVPDSKLPSILKLIEIAACEFSDAGSLDVKAARKKLHGLVNDYAVECAEPSGRTPAKATARVHSA